MAGDLRQKLFTALTGQAADVRGDPGGDVRGMLLAVGGASTKTHSGIDLTRAARSLGVSRRTVERWVRTAQTGTGQRPSPSHAQALARQARQAASTRRGRAAAVSASGIGRAAARGARLSITALQGPHSLQPPYGRRRTTQMDLDPAAAAGMLSAWEAGGEKGFMAWATSHWGENYVDEWRFGDVSDITVEQPFGGDWR
jgi:transposase-like protein